MFVGSSDQSKNHKSSNAEITDTRQEVHEQKWFIYGKRRRIVKEVGHGLVFKGPLRPQSSPRRIV